MNARPLPVLTPNELADFWNRIVKTDDCWLWTGTWIPIAKGSRHKYGVFNLRRGGRRFNVKAHRVTKALVSGDHPEFDIDHTCQNKLCVNPDHLDWVTHPENKRRSRLNRCKRGHDISLPQNRDSLGWRCRICMNERRREYRAKRKVAA